MENGLQEFIKQNINLLIAFLLSVLGVLLSFIGVGFITFIKLIYKYIKEKNERSDQRFKEGEKKFEKLENGQEGIREEIQKGQEREEIQREQIKDSIGKIGKGLLILQTQHKENHK